MSSKKVKGKKKKPLGVKLQRGTALYAIVKFIDYSGKLFECIPESWFVNEEKTLCFWPPKTGKSFTLRAMIQEIPDDEDWEVYECKVISEGHATYSIGAAIVREKCAQNYNTSSAEEHQQAEKFRRQHPGLIDKSEKSIEKVFSTVNLTKPLNNNGEIENKKQQEKSKSFSTTDSVTNINYSGSGANDYKSRSRTDSRSGSRTESRSANKKLSQSPTSHAKSSNRSNSRSRSRTHSQSGIRSESDNNKKRSQSRSSYSESSRRSNSRQSRSSNRKYLQSRSSNSKSSSRSYTQSRSRSHSQSFIRWRGRSRSGSNTRPSSVSQNRISISSSRSRSKSRSFVPTQRSHTRSEDRSYSHANGRYRNESITNESIRSREVTGSTVRNGSKFKTRPTSSSIRTSRLSLNPPAKTISSHQYRERFNSNTTSRRNSSIRIQTNSNTNLQRNDSLSPYRRLERQNTQSTRESYQKIETLIEEVKELKRIVNKNNRRFVQNDQRLTRMEVTVNKSFIMLGDLAQSLNTRMSMLNSLARPNSPPRGFQTPHLPIMNLRKLASLNRDLKDRKFRLFLINDQKEFCTPSKKSSDNVTMTAYLKRFISVPIRASIVLKDLKGQLGETLYENYHQVYLFLIEVMKAGYLLCGQIITNNDVHSTLRVVWGRSKQMLNEETKKNRSHRH